MSRTVTVSTQAELVNALKSSTGGDTILLKAGDYGDLTLIDKPAFDLGFGSTVTIGAADPNNPPVITKLDLRGAANLSFENILFDYTYKDGQPISTKPFMVSSSTTISFDSCTFDGDKARGLSEVDNGYPAGFGLNVTGTTGISIDNCEISGFFRGLVVNRSDAVSVTNNDVHSIRMDGMNFAAVQGVLIEGNNIHDFDRSMSSTDHSDMIQFWTASTTRPSTDIVIRNNVLDVGTGHYTQSIFMRNELVDRGLAGPEMFYQNVLIEGNTIVNGQAHGITVGETAGLTITQNSVLHSDGINQDGIDAPVEIPRIWVAARSTDVSITQNATSDILGQAGQADWNVSMNAFVQDQNQNAPGWYGDVFIASTLTSSDGAAAIRALDSGMMGRLGAGAPSQLVAPTSVTVDAAFHTTTKTAGGNDVYFDASYSTGSQPVGTTYKWDFGDGTTASGLKVTHSYADGGIYDAKLIITLPDGTQNSETSKVNVTGSQLVSLNADGTFIASQSGIDTVLSSIRDHDAAGGIQLGNPGIAASIARDQLAPMFTAQDVTISLKLDADAAGKTGEVVRIHGSFIVSVTAKGELSVQAWSSTGDAVTLTSTGQPVNNGNSYDVDVRLEGGRLSLWINDTMLQEAAFNGKFADVGSHDLTFGNPWSSSFQGDVTEFSIAINDGMTSVASGGTQSSGTAAATDSAVDAAPPVVAASVAASVEAPITTAPPTETTATTATTATTVTNDNLVSLSNDGHFVVTKNGAETALDSIRDQDAAGGIQLGAKGISASVGRDHLAPMFGTDDVTISLQLDADAAGTTGEIMRVSGSFIAAVDFKGELSVRAWSSTGDAVTLTSTGQKVNDGNSYDVDVRLEGGRLSLWINDTMVKDTAFNGSFADVGRTDLTFGNPWHSSFFTGDVTAFSIAIDDGLTQVDPFTALAIDHAALVI